MRDPNPFMNAGGIPAWMLQRMNPMGAAAGYFQNMAQNAGRSVLDMAGMPQLDPRQLMQPRGAQAGGLSPNFSGLANVAGAGMDAAKAAFSAPWLQSPPNTATPQPAATAAATPSMAPRPRGSPVPAGGVDPSQIQVGLRGSSGAINPVRPTPSSLSPAKSPGVSFDIPNRMEELSPALGGGVARPAGARDVKELLDGNLAGRRPAAFDDSLGGDSNPYLGEKGLDPIREVTDKDTETFKPRGPLDRLKMWASEDADKDGITRGGWAAALAAGLADTWAKHDQLTPLGQEMPNGTDTMMKIVGMMQGNARARKAEARQAELDAMQRKQFGWAETDRGKSEARSKKLEEFKSRALEDPKYAEIRDLIEATPAEGVSAVLGSERASKMSIDEMRRRMEFEAREGQLNRDASLRAARISASAGAARANTLTEPAKADVQEKYTPFISMKQNGSRVIELLDQNKNVSSFDMFAGNTQPSRDLQQALGFITMDVKKNEELGALVGGDFKIINALMGASTSGDWSAFAQGRYKPEAVRTAIFNLMERTQRQHELKWKTLPPGLQQQIDPYFSPLKTWAPKDGAGAGRAQHEGARAADFKETAGKPAGTTLVDAGQWYVITEAGTLRAISAEEAKRYGKGAR